jgi:catechol 2,3-dioxygenase
MKTRLLAFLSWKGVDYFSWSIKMNTETIVHPKLHHLGLTTANLDVMMEWYRKVLGMTLVHRSAVPVGGQKDAPSLTAAWVSNDEANHRLAFVQLPGLTADPDRARHQRMQHVAFEYRTIDDLLGTYARLKALGVVPVLSTDGGPQTAFYYEDPPEGFVTRGVAQTDTKKTAF